MVEPSTGLDTIVNTTGAALSPTCSNLRRSSDGTAVAGESVAGLLFDFMVQFQLVWR
jgi:hypothetical protein